MKYSENTIPKSPGQLRDAITFTLVHANQGSFPDWCGLDFEGAFYQLLRGVENLRKRFGEAKANQLADMLEQAKTHYKAGEVKWGSWLMQDSQEVIADRRPFAYPKDMYRWPIDPRARDVQPSDLEREDAEDD